MDIVIDFLKKLNDEDELFGVSSEANEKKVISTFLKMIYIIRLLKACLAETIVHLLASEITKSHALFLSRYEIFLRVKF